jgi:hypothetical protein
MSRPFRVEALVQRLGDAQAVHIATEDDATGVAAHIVPLAPWAGVVELRRAK